MIRGPGNSQAVFACFRKRNVSSYVILVGDVNGSKRLFYFLLRVYRGNSGLNRFLVGGASQFVGEGDGHHSFLIRRSGYGSVRRNHGLIPLAPGNLYIINFFRQGKILFHRLQAFIGSLYRLQHICQKQGVLLFRAGQSRLDLLLAHGSGVNPEIRQVGRQQSVRLVEGFADIAKDVVRQYILDGLILGDRAYQLSVQVQLQISALAGEGDGAVAVYIPHAGAAVIEPAFFPFIAGHCFDGSQEIAALLAGAGIHKDIVSYVLRVPGSHSIADGEQPVGRGGLGGQSRLNRKVLAASQVFRNRSRKFRVAVIGQFPDVCLTAGVEIFLLRAVENRVIAVSGYILQGIALMGHIVSRQQSCVSGGSRRLRGRFRRICRQRRTGLRGFHSRFVALCGHAGADLLRVQSLIIELHISHIGGQQSVRLPEGFADVSQNVSLRDNIRHRIRVFCLCNLLSVQVQGQSVVLTYQGNGAVIAAQILGGGGKSYLI